MSNIMTVLLCNVKYNNNVTPFYHYYLVLILKTLFLIFYKLSVLCWLIGVDVYMNVPTVMPYSMCILLCLTCGNKDVNHWWWHNNSQDSKHCKEQTPY